MQGVVEVVGRGASVNEAIGSRSASAVQAVSVTQGVVEAISRRKAWEEAVG
jgi:hypothetical protein